MWMPRPESLCWLPLMLTTPDMQRTEQETVLYLTDGTLPENEKRAQELDVMKSEYTLADLVLYHVKLHKAFRFLPPSQRKNSFSMPTAVHMELICIKQRSTATLPNTSSGHGLVHFALFFLLSSVRAHLSKMLCGTLYFESCMRTATK